MVFKGLKPLDPISRQLRVEGRKFAEEEDEEEDGEIYEELARRRVKAAKAPNPTIDGTSSNAQDSDPINLAKTECVVPSVRLKDDRLLPY